VARDALDVLAQARVLLQRAAASSAFSAALMRRAITTGGRQQEQGEADRRELGIGARRIDQQQVHRLRDQHRHHAGQQHLRVAAGAPHRPHHRHAM
jgi:hypothetical protein